MSTTISNQAELQKLLHLLQAEKDTNLSFLNKLTKEEIQLLRLKIVDISQFTQTDIWSRLTGVSKFFPNYMNAKVAETVLGALITANMSYYMPEKDAVSIMKYMSNSFLCNVSDFLIPEKAQKLISHIPIDLLKKITTELIKQKKYVTAAGFVDVLEMTRLLELSKVIYKEDDLIHIATYAGNKAYIAKIVEGFDDNRIGKIITYAYSNQLHENILNIFVHLSSNEVQRILKIVSTLSPNIKTKVLEDFENRIQS